MIQRYVLSAILPLVFLSNLISVTVFLRQRVAPQVEVLQKLELREYTFDFPERVELCQLTAMVSAV